VSVRQEKSAMSLGGSIGMIFDELTESLVSIPARYAG
jgi:hypothetical protein